MIRRKVSHDVNIRRISAFREIGKGHVDIERFCGYMDSNQEIHSPYTKTAEDSMKAAALDVRKMVLDDDEGNDGIGNVDVCRLYVAETRMCFFKWRSNCNRGKKWKMVGI